MEFFRGRHFMSSLFMVFVFTTLLDSILGKHHIRHHRDRFKRQHGAHLYLPDSFVTSDGEGPDRGPWNSWSEPSPCSKSCGGGVSTQYRQCQYGYNCQGPSKKHFSCNTQDCPDLSDFRAQQCSEYDSIPFEGVYYQWIPYTKAPNPCELNCMPRGERFYYRHKQHVVDGTRCTDEKLDICVEGTCQPVGCDMMLGSNMKEDRCRQCGGDESMCNTVSGTLSMQDLQVGYNDILLIPEGATNIDVREIAPSNNYLAIRNTSGYYYLNGNWRIDFPRTLDFAGCRFHYDRFPRGFSAPDSITCLGPTYEPLFIVLLYQDINVGVSYEYSVPQGVQHGDATETYAWTYDAFTPCSASCGGGVQYRNVTCASRRLLEPADRGLCDRNTEPPAARRCNDQPCEPSWAVRPWEQCSAACGDTGTQTRQVYCEQVIANGIASIVDDQYCVNVQKPVTQQPCNQGLICAKWHRGRWKPCSHLCGDGVQTRDVTCYRKGDDGKIEVLDDAYCLPQENKPQTQKRCNLRPCEGVSWVTSEWSGCQGKCGLSNETRRAVCATTKDEVLTDDLCQDIPLPELVRQCKEDSSCQFQWYTSQWSECSAKCGSGVQTRKVFCGSPNSDGVQRVADSKCNPDKKYDNIKQCQAEEDECPGEWFAGLWSECSEECSGGIRSRKVICLKDNVTSTPSQCDPNTIVLSNEECNTNSCGKEETTVASDVSEDSSSSSSDFIDIFTTAEPGEDESDYEYEVTLEESCDDGEWVGEDEDFTGSTESELSTALDEELMQGDDPAAGAPADIDVGSGDALWSSTSEGSGDYSTSDYSSESTVDLTATTESDDPYKTTTKSAKTTAKEPVINISGESPVGAEEDPESDEKVMHSSATTVSDESTIETSPQSTGATESTESPGPTESTESPGPTESTESPGPTESTESPGPTESTESPAPTESTESAGPTDSTESPGPTESTESPGPTESTESPGPTESTESPGPTKSTESPGPTESTLEASSQSSGPTESTESPGPTESTESPGPTESTESPGPTESTESPGPTESTLEASSESSGPTESTESPGPTESTESPGPTESTESPGPTESTESPGPTESTESPGPTESTESPGPTESTESPGPTESTESPGPTESTLEASSESSGPTESTESPGPTESTESPGPTESTLEASSESSGPTESTESPGPTESTESPGPTESTESPGPTESTESPGPTESTEEASSESSGPTESTDSPGSTESTIETSSESSGPTESTIETSSESTGPTESTDSTESTASVSTESESSSEYDIWGSTESTEWGSSTIADLFLPKKLRKCKRRVKKTCKKSKYGCCIDKITPAQGPFHKGCPTTTTCKEAPYGCCEDGVSVAKGKGFQGCPSTYCNETLFGCCPDKKTAAEGNDNEGCPPACLSSKYGCCSDNITAANGPDEEGCEEETTTSISTTESGTETTSEEESTVSGLESSSELSSSESSECQKSAYGCCPDGVNLATGEDYEGCDIIKENCSESYFGCCPDRVSSAKGPNYKGCKMACDESQFGCCSDGVTPAHGPYKEGCCLATPNGCCPDNIRPAQGPNLEGCGCEYSPYRCCPDNITAALGYNNEGCGCQYNPNGCCPDNQTPATGSEYEGCPCTTFQFGCCSDGSTAAQGPFEQGCGCRNSEHGCCGDESTPAKGPNNEGCSCETTKYGCCPDGVYEARGDNFEGCEEAPVNLQTSCSIPKERGSCRNYTVKWFFDLEYGGCSRFWYGGCDGNDNRFKSKEECNEICVEPQGKNRCALPKVSGACEGYYPQWYYDMERKTCSQFIYSGCLGNNNKFETREECLDLCAETADGGGCEQPKEEGPCRGNFARWYFDKTAGKCIQFIYGGCKGNGNNYQTEAACKQQCAQPGKLKDYCSLPKVEGSCTGKEARWYHNETEKRCVPFYYSSCDGNNNNFASEEECKEICPKVVEKSICQLPAEIGECGTYAYRWYYDTRDKRCRQFYYGGCGGNGNNFETENACLQRCTAPVTTAPPPVVIRPQQPVTPPVEVGQFTLESCFLESETGPCRSFDPRWYYDKTDGSCKQFMYGGCQGNANNFKTAEECHSNCGSVQDLCTLPQTVGPCRGEYEQWYYNRVTDQCETFTYGGCLGNDNRFEDQYSCEQRCKQRQGPTQGYATRAPPPAVIPTIPSDIRACYDPLDQGTCDDRIPSYYFDLAAGRCTPFEYTGCGGNANRYVSEEQCERQCGQFRGQDVCRLQRDPGTCDGYILKYYYDGAAARCGQFAYTGCDGNGNRFSTQEECESVCAGQQQPQPPPVQPNATASAICRLPLDVGPCEGGSQKLYYFDDTRGECAPFIYSGCGGNANNFKTFQACVDLCREFLAPTEPPRVVPTEVNKGEHPCQKYIDACGTMRCEFDVEAYTDDETLCTMCRCRDPCQNVICDRDSKCAIDLNRNRTTYEDPTYLAVCRQINKDGNCPYNSERDSDRCDRECENDADCSMDLKCCPSGCGTSCTPPAAARPAPLTSSLPAYTQPPSRTGTYAPVVNEEKFRPEVVGGEGDYATLQCAVHGNPTPTITWKRGHLVIDGAQPRYRLLLDGALQIITLHKTDSGIYLCAADNGIGEPIEKAIKLEVTNSDPHSTSIIGDEENSQAVVALGTQTTLHCYAIGYPFPAVTWWKDDSMIPLRTTQFEVRKDYSLLIHSVQLSNLGIYTCQAYNGIGKAASWSVTVQAIGPVFSTRPEDSQYLQYVINPPQRYTTADPYYRPQVTPLAPIDVPQPPAEGHVVYQVPVRVNITQHQTRFLPGSEISVGCDVEGYPIPTVQWFKDGHQLLPSSFIQISASHRLHISNAQESDSGEYRCEAVNDYSRSAATIGVTIEGVYIHPNCTDNQFFANCQLIVRANYCLHNYYAKFCCKSCTEAGQLPSYGPHLDVTDDKQNALNNNLLRRK